MKTKAKKLTNVFPLPPKAFSDAVPENYIWHDNWRDTPDWKIFVAGYNEAVRVHNEAVMKQWNMTECSKRIFGSVAK